MALVALATKVRKKKNGHPNKLILKQQTEGATIKTERAVLGPVAIYREMGR
jgi:hypothetical protein